MNYRELLHKIVRYFDEDELETICFDLDLDYNNLKGGQKKARVREMIITLEKLKRIDDLIEILAEERPDIKW